MSQKSFMCKCQIKIEMKTNQDKLIFTKLNVTTYAYTRMYVNMYVF